MTDANLQRYLEFYENLSADTVEQFSEVVTDDIHFMDPFNDVHGLEDLQKIFRHMFESLDAPKFTVTHAALSSEKIPRGLISWELRASLSGKPWNVDGMSEVGFAADGRVNEHIDHWDASRQFYGRLPVIGWLLNLIRARLAV